VKSDCPLKYFIISDSVVPSDSKQPCLIIRHFNRRKSSYLQYRVLHSDVLSYGLRNFAVHGMSVVAIVNSYRVLLVNIVDIIVHVFVFLEVS